MAGARGDALEWALALARAPAERLVLRQRPLPEGIEGLLQIAAGGGGAALSEAALRTGETEESVVDAARFYLREVLFHSGADAYRILGLPRDASAATVKAHHRWLQQWLHPDRHTSDWDAIFAGRVNAAWNQLRNADRRRAYDAEHQASSQPASGSLQVPSVTGSARWSHSLPEPTSRARWERRAPLLALLVACAGLGLLALRDLARDEGLVSAHADAREYGSIEAASGAGDMFETLHLPAKSPPPVATVVSTTESRKRRGAVSPSVVRLPEPREPLPARAPPMLEKVTPLAVLSRRSGSQQTEPPPVPKADRVLAVESVKPISKPAAAAGTAATPRRVPPPVRTVASAPTSASSMQFASAPSPTPTGAPALPAATSVAPYSAAAPAAIPTSVVSAERVRQVQQAGSRLLEYMSGRTTAVPPIWGSLVVQQGAGRVRKELLASGKVAFADPDWRVGAQDAQLQVEVRYPDGRQGRLAAGLAWREQRWLVNRLSMERDW